MIRRWQVCLLNTGFDNIQLDVFSCVDYALTLFRLSERHHLEAIIRSALSARGYGADGGGAALAFVDRIVDRLLSCIISSRTVGNKDFRGSTMSAIPAVRERGNAAGNVCPDERPKRFRGEVRTSLLSPRIALPFD
jgi:hypothetical protein